MIELRGITKRFPGMLALDDVSFSVAGGHCHAICGENGAGKSTLGKILAGIHAPDAGAIQLDGLRVQFASPREALATGVAMVHQELAFCDNMSVAENLCLGALPSRRGIVDRVALRDRARDLLKAVGATIDPDRAISSLSVAEQQLVQIAAAVAASAKVIIFDEPTSSLGPSESEALYALIDRLKARGVAVLYVSHRMAELFRIADAMTVLRDGKHVGTWPTRDLNEETLVQHMIGRSLSSRVSRGIHSHGEEALRIESFASPGKFEHVNLTVGAGEVVGLAGLVGAGRSEIAQAIFGLDRNATGSVFVRGKSARIRNARDAMNNRIGFVPEDRKHCGLVLSMCAGDNLTLPILSRFARLGVVDTKAERGEAAGFFDRLKIKARPSSPSISLSGGTQQKIVLAKWLAARCDILILDEPTRGVDVGTKAEIHEWIEQLAEEGMAILLISSELPELLSVASRMVVLRAGRVVGELGREDASQTRLLRMMAGLAA